MGTVIVEHRLETPLLEKHSLSALEHNASNASDRTQSSFDAKCERAYPLKIVMGDISRVRLLTFRVVARVVGTSLLPAYRRVLHQHGDDTGRCGRCCRCGRCGRCVAAWWIRAGDGVELLVRLRSGLLTHLVALLASIYNVRIVVDHAGDLLGRWKDS